MKKIFITLILLLLSYNVSAYENEYFNINIPEYYVEDGIKASIYKWINTNNTNENIVITVSKNENHQQIKKYTANDIKEYEEYLKKQLDEELKEYNINVEISNTKKEIINGIYNLNYYVYWPTKDSIGYNIYQKGYIFTTNDLIFVCNFTSDKDLINNNDLINIINSFNPNNYKNNKNLRVKLVILTGTLAAIISTIIKYIKAKKHKSNN